VTSVFAGNLIYNNVPFFDGVFRLVQEGGNFQTILKAKKSDFCKKSDFSMA
jgi:hypothetical protein